MDLWSGRLTVIAGSFNSNRDEVASMSKDEHSAASGNRRNPFRAVVDYHEALENESARGAAILAAAHFEHYLTRAIEDQFIEFNKKVRDRIFRQAVRSFSEKINMGFDLGLYDSDTQEDLHRIRQIRNEFAHSHGPLEFGDEPVSVLCRGLSTSGLFEDPREMYLARLTQVESQIVLYVIDFITNPAHRQ